MDKLLGVLINSAEKAADVARLVREDELLFRMLVNKKESNEANPRFVEDFKTLADMLVQELVKRDVTRAVSGLIYRVWFSRGLRFDDKKGLIC